MSERSIAMPVEIVVDKVVLATAGAAAEQIGLWMLAALIAFWGCEHYYKHWKLKRKISKAGRGIVMPQRLSAEDELAEIRRRTEERRVKAIKDYLEALQEQQDAISRQEIEQEKRSVVASGLVSIQ